MHERCGRIGENNVFESENKDEEKSYYSNKNVHLIILYILYYNGHRTAYTTTDAAAG